MEKRGLASGASGLSINDFSLISLCLKGKLSLANSVRGTLPRFM